MKLRVAKKIVKNQEVLKYHKGQVKRAQIVVSRNERNAQEA